LKRIIDKLKEAENEDNNNNEYIQRMRDGVKADKVSLKEKLRVYNQLMIGIVSVATLRFLLDSRAEHLWMCPAPNEAES
jgi:hypothetical protein